MICSICGCEMKNNGGWFACPTCGSVHFGPDPNENKSAPKPEAKKEAAPAEPAEKPMVKKASDLKPAETAKPDINNAPVPEEKPEKSNSDFLFFIQDLEENSVKANTFTPTKTASDNEKSAADNKTDAIAEKEAPKPAEKVAEEPKEAPKPVEEVADEPKEAPKPVEEAADEPKEAPKPVEEAIAPPEETEEALSEAKKAKAKKEKKSKKEKQEKPAEQEESTEQESENKNKKSKLKDIVDFMLPIVAAVIIAFVLKTFIIANAKVPTGSMIDTINIGDRIIASRLAYITETPSRYDIILFYYPDDETDIFVKRVIGLPGETLEVIDGVTYVTTKDGKTIQTDQSFVNPAEIPEDNYGPHYIPEKGEVISVDGDYCYAENGMLMGDRSFLDKYCVKEGFKYVIAENLYFMMGDNRNQSADSRRWVFPFVAENKIIGKVMFRYYPFDSIGKIK